MPGESSAMSVCWFAHVWHLNLSSFLSFTFNNATSFMHPTPTKLAEDGITTLSLDLILPGPGNHHRKSHWLEHDLEHFYTSTYNLNQPLFHI